MLQNGVPNLFISVPRINNCEPIVSALPRRIYANAHAYHINSIALNSDGETYISSDDLRINLWNLEINNQSFSMKSCLLGKTNLIPFQILLILNRRIWRNCLKSLHLPNSTHLIVTYSSTAAAKEASNWEIFVILRFATTRRRHLRNLKIPPVDHSFLK